MNYESMVRALELAISRLWVRLHAAAFPGSDPGQVVHNKSVKFELYEPYCHLELYELLT